MMRFLLPTLFSLLLLPASRVAHGQLVIGHRGASADAPENTLASFNLAWKRGADGVEGDFYLSSDGHIVCIHDRDTKRVAGVKYVVGETTFDDLRKLDVGAWKGEKWRGQQIPTLEEVLATVPPRKKIFIELKVGPQIVKPLQRILAASKVRPEQIVIISFSKEAIAACEELMPELRSHWLTGYKKQQDGSWKPSPKEVAATIEKIHADGLGSHANLDFVNQAFLDQFHAAGEDEFHVWTVDKLEVAKLYQKLGAWSITTDRPGWLRKELNQAQPAKAEN